ncbi:MAG: hypothetical protein QOF35_1918 [Actinomycetota bacterium]|nr:hypothetical protein [Actinomycetota bacterium]
MSHPLRRWLRRYCEHPDAYVTRTGAGRILREVCPTCGGEVSLVAFDSVEDALDALRETAGDAARTTNHVVAVERMREPPGFMLWEPVIDPEPY